jgi:hypothetical protein
MRLARRSFDDGVVCAACGRAGANGTLRRMLLQNSLVPSRLIFAELNLQGSDLVTIFLALFDVARCAQIDQ